MAHSQLHLLNVDEEPWKLDDRTIRVGRKGLATARAALARSARPYDEPTSGDPTHGDPTHGDPTHRVAA